MNKERGVSLILVMSIFIILGLLVITLMTMSMSEMRISAAGSDSKIAFHSAEAGLERGISEVPAKCEAFPASPDTWVTLVNNAKYKSGLPNTIPTPPQLVGAAYKEGFSIEEGNEFFDFKYDVTTSGKMNKSKRVVKARVKCGPLGRGGTQY
jgi:Tfp pilus assembly protein PilX